MPMIHRFHPLRLQHGWTLFDAQSTVENGSELFVAAESPLLTKLDLREQPIRLGNMMSRKKDILPWFGEKLRQS
jgi:hypothetical protein